MKSKITLLILALFTFGLQSCFEGSQNNKVELTEENSLNITHKLGETRVLKSPERIVIFDLGALDMLDELGLADKVVGMPKQSVPAYLMAFKENKDIINTGSLVEPNFQKTNEANPDLIIMSGRQEKDYEEFSKIAPTIFFDLDYKDYIGSVKHNLNTLAKIYDVEDKAASIIQDLDKHIASVAPSDEELTGLFVLYNNGKFSAYGRGSRFGYIHDDFGITPVSEDLESSRHGQSISSEFIHEMNPDFLFILDRNAAIGDGQLNKVTVENGLVRETKAYQNNRIVYLSSDIWYLAGGGIKAMELMADEIIDAM